MGEFKKRLQKKIDSRGKKGQKLLSPQERMVQEQKQLQMAYRFLEKIAAETKRSGDADSCKGSADGEGTCSIFRKKVKRKIRHLYFNSVCAYNPTLQCLVAAMEDFARAQVAWNEALEERYETELRELREELAQLQKKQPVGEVPENER